MSLRGMFLIILFFCLLLAGNAFYYRVNYATNQKIEELEREIQEQELQLEMTSELLEEITQLRKENEALYKKMEQWLETWQVEPFEATAYTLACGNGDGYTASMTRPEVGRTIAVDPDIIPLGSSVYISGLGWHRAEDTGGLIKGNTIDLYLGEDARARGQAFKWGRREVLVAYEKNKK